MVRKIIRIIGITSAFFLTIGSLSYVKNNGKIPLLLHFSSQRSIIGALTFGNISSSNPSATFLPEGTQTPFASPTVTPASQPTATPATQPSPVSSPVYSITTPTPSTVAPTSATAPTHPTQKDPTPVAYPTAPSQVGTFTPVVTVVPLELPSPASPQATPKPTGATVPVTTPTEILATPTLSQEDVLNIFRAEIFQSSQHGIVFSGTAAPNSPISLEIHSPDAIIVHTVSTTNGTWNYLLTYPLSQGTHTATVTFMSIKSVNKRTSLIQNFFVAPVQAASSLNGAALLSPAPLNLIPSPYILVFTVLLLSACITTFSIYRRQITQENIFISINK